MCMIRGERCVSLEIPSVRYFQKRMYVWNAEQTSTSTPRQTSACNCPTSASIPTKKETASTAPKATP